MKTLKVVLLVAATALILLLTPRAAAAQSHCGDLIYQTGINSDGPPGTPDGDCSESLPIIGSFIASALAVGLVLVLAIRSFVLGAADRGLPKPAAASPKGPKPALGEPGAAEWRYQRYLADRQAKGVQPNEGLSFEEWKSRYYDPAVQGGRPGRRGGPEQVVAKEQLTREGIKEVENVRLGGRYPDGIDPIPNPRGGTDYYEVGKMLEKGTPEARERIKLQDEIGALGRNDIVTFVDKSNPANRIRYVRGDDVDLKTGAFTRSGP